MDISIKLNPRDIFRDTITGRIVIVKSCNTEINEVIFYEIDKTLDGEITFGAEEVDLVSYTQFISVVTHSTWEYIGSNLEVARILYDIPVEVLNELQRTETE